MKRKVKKKMFVRNYKLQIIVLDLLSEDVFVIPTYVNMWNIIKL